MKTIDEKITAIINHFNLNNYAFSKRIGVTGTTIDSIVNGRPQADGTRKKTKPGYDVLSAIINEFNINTDYLFGKSSIMLQSDAANIQTYSGIPQVISTNNDTVENVVFVPVKARAGYLNGYGDANFIKTLPSFSMPYLTNGTFRCFEVQGNSMLATFSDSDLVFGKYVETLKEIKDGGIYIVVSKNDGIVLKRVVNRINKENKLILESDNKDGNYPKYTIDAHNITEIWQVVMYASKQIPQATNIFDRINELENQVSKIKTNSN